MGMPQDLKLNQSMEKTRFRRGRISDNNKQREEEEEEERGRKFTRSSSLQLQLEKDHFFYLHAL
jgi:hypothetical protein